MRAQASTTRPPVSNADSPVYGTEERINAIHGHSGNLEGKKPGGRPSTVGTPEAMRTQWANHHKNFYFHTLQLNAGKTTPVIFAIVSPLIPADQPSKPKN